MNLDIDKINTLEYGIKVAIDGAGECGRELKKIIEKKRPDIKIVCFFDGMVTGDIDGLETYPVEEVKKYSNLYDIVLVASYSNAPIMSAVLTSLGVKNQFIITGYKKNKNNDCISQNDKFKKVVEKLNSKESKKVFELIVKGYNCKSCFQNLVKYLKKDSKKIAPENREQYFDFINKEAIKTVISGGVYDGGTSILMLQKLKNLKQLYGFEPSYQKFKIGVQDKIIKESGKIEIIEKGLLDKSTGVSFNNGSYGSKIQDSEKPWTSIIQTISIDEFIEEKNIKRVDFIKMDIEGSELSALKGAAKTILKDRPQLAISIYHSFEELLDIPLYLYELLENYKFEVYHYDWNNSYESILYAIPDELYY